MMLPNVVMECNTAVGWAVQEKSLQTFEKGALLWLEGLRLWRQVAG